MKKPLLIVITSNKGLCGGFNSSIIKEVYNLASEYGSNTPDLLTIGKKGNDILRKKFNVISSHNEVYDNFSYSSVKEIAENIMQRFENEEYDEILLVYNHFKNAATQIITKEQYLPILDDSDETSNVQGDYIFEPNRAKILEELIPKSLAIQLFKAISDSIAGEHGARMTAMHKATDNATDLRDQLKLTYNKARQTAITNEILEIEKYFNNQQFFFEAFMYLFHPQIKKTFDLIEQDEIGEIISMESFFGNNILTKKKMVWFYKKKKNQ